MERPITLGVQSVCRLESSLKLLNRLQTILVMDAYRVDVFTCLQFLVRALIERCEELHLLDLNLFGSIHRAYAFTVSQMVDWIFLHAWLHVFHRHIHVINLIIGGLCSALVIFLILLLLCNWCWSDKLRVL